MPCTYCPAISSRTSTSSWSWTPSDRSLNCTDPCGRLRYRLSWIRRWFRNKELAGPQDSPSPPTRPSNCPQDRKDTWLCPFPRLGRTRGEVNGSDCSVTDIQCSINETWTITVRLFLFAFRVDWDFKVFGGIREMVIIIIMCRRSRVEHIFYFLSFCLLLGYYCSLIRIVGSLLVLNIFFYTFRIIFYFILLKCFQVGKNCQWIYWIKYMN